MEGRLVINRRCESLREQMKEEMPEHSENDFNGRLQGKEKKKEERGGGINAPNKKNQNPLAQGLSFGG